MKSGHSIPSKSWYIALLVVVAFLTLANSADIGSVDTQRNGCKINHTPQQVDQAKFSADTLPVLTRKMLSGTWLYRSIDTFHQGLGPRKGGIYTAAKLDKGEWIPLPLSSNDTMKIAENGPFFYSIAAINKKAWGRARVESCSLPLSATGYQLALYYDQGSTTNAAIRQFRIQHFSGDSLVIQEGNTYFRYSRRK